MTDTSKQIRSVDGKIVGHIKDGTFYKKVKRSRHYMKVLNAYGMDARILNEDFSEVRILDLESDQVYSTSKDIWQEHGIKKNFGHGDQIFLPLHYFQVESKNQPAMI